MIHWIYRFLSRIWLGIFFRLRTEGVENIPPKGGLLIASNHASILDPIVAACGSTRWLTYLARQSLNEGLVYRIITGRIPIIAISRGAFDREALRNVAEAVNEGQAVLVFPEGTRSADGRLGEIKAGVQLLARMTSAPVVPMFIAGTHRAWPRGKSRPALCGRIRVRFGPPLDISHLPKDEAQEALRAAIERLAPEELRNPSVQEVATPAPDR